MLDEELDAKSFIKSEGTYLNELNLVLRLLIYCYGQIIENEVFNPNEIEDKFENHIRNVLVDKYLRKYKVRYNIGYLYFDVETGVINSAYKTSGFLDIYWNNPKRTMKVACKLIKNI